MEGANKQVVGLLLLTVWFMVQRCNAFEYKVGGSQGWTLPTDPNAPIYNHWAQNTRFQIGDSLLFVYSSDHDSVLLVTKENYDNCSTEKPLEEFKDGHTVYKFNHSGPYYFISGVADHCHSNEKLIVVVMADRTKHASNGTVGVPSPSPSPEMSPPSPAPSGEESPSPPPAEGTEPTPAPSEESSPPKSGVSSIACGVVGTIVVFLGSSLALAL